MPWSALQQQVESLKEVDGKSPLNGFCHFPVHSTEEHGVRIAKSADRRVDASEQSWARKAEGSGPPEVDYCSELRNRVQLAILAAEKNEASGMEDRLLSLLRFFEIGQEWFLKQEQQGEQEGKL